MYLRNHIGLGKPVIDVAAIDLAGADVAAFSS
jgi:hypothetical protein